MKVQWNKRSAFGGYELDVLRWPEEASKKRCYNPWNLMTPDERKQVKSCKPKKTRDVCDLNCLLTNSIIKEEDIHTELTEIIGADCWGVFITNNDRTEIIKVYFDSRKSQYLNAEPIRDNLLEDPSELVDYIRNGDTVVVVMGGNEFYEYYYQKINGVILLSKIDHTLKW